MLLTPPQKRNEEEIGSTPYPYFVSGMYGTMLAVSRDPVENLSHLKITYVARVPSGNWM